MDWQPIETAPRDGSVIQLAWMGHGKPAGIWPMCWSQSATNPPMWVTYNQQTGEIELMWREDDPDGGPTHWRPQPR